MKPLNLFILLTFVLFIVGFGITGMLIAFESPNFLVVIAQILMAWTPTFAYAIVHRRVSAERTFWQSIKDRFKDPIKALPLLASVLIPVVATLIVGVGYSMVSGKALFDLFAKLSMGSILLFFFDGLIRGPLGEELGWRGYLQNELNKRHSVLKSSLIVGGIWGIWHFPLWFISGFQGANLLLYILFFFIGLVAFSVIIGNIYSKNGNLLYAILLHQMLNFSGRLLEFDELTILGGSSAVYVVIAIAMVLVSRESIKKQTTPA